MAKGRMTERGWIETTRVGDLVFTYRSGRDAPRDVPLFDMAVGEITFENLGERPVRLEYTIPDTFFGGHLFEIGPAQELAWKHPRPAWSEPDDAIDFACPPGKKGLLSRQDYLHLVHEIGRARLLDGTMRTQYGADLRVDGELVRLEFGPHVFRVELDRDWAAEQARYEEHFVARDRGEIPL